MTRGLLEAAGGIGLFLLGMVVMTRGLKALAGAAQARALARFTHSPASAAATGAVSTAVIQSSSATTVAAVGFVGAGLLSFPQALGIVFGANLGTTITGWLVALVGFKLELGAVAMPLLLVGVLVHLFARGRARWVGLALAGFALVFVGIGALKEGLSGLEGSVTPESFPDDTLGGRLLLVLIGVLVTLVTQSSSAGVAAAITAVHAGTLHFEQAAAMVIGMDIGTTFTAWLATVGGSTQARRTGYAQILYNLLTAAGALLLLTPYTLALERFGGAALADDPELCLVGFHTLFNGLGVVAVLPVAARFARLIERLVPDRGPRLAAGLDPALLEEAPAYGLEAVHGALTEVAPAVFRAIASLLRSRASTARAIEELAPAMAALTRTRAFLRRVTTTAEDAPLHARHQSLMHAIDHLQRLADRCCRRSPAEGVRGSATIARASAELAARLASLEPRPSEAQVEACRDLRQRLVGEDERFRREVLERAASSELAGDAAIARMDELRRLRRTAYHVWRIVHHLRRARSEDGPGETDDLAPHAELDAE